MESCAEKALGGEHVEQHEEHQPSLRGLDLEDRTIFRVQRDREHPYSQVLKTLQRDASISLEARGLLQFMLSFPDDWDFNVRHMAQANGVSRSMIARILLELIEAGYVVREQARRGSGRFGKARYLVFETPRTTVSRLPDTVPPDTVDTAAGATAHGETTTTDKEELTDDLPETEDIQEGEAPPPAGSARAPDPAPIIAAMQAAYLKSRGLFLDLADREVRRAKTLAGSCGTEAVVRGFNRWLSRTERNPKPVRFFLDDFKDLYAPRARSPPAPPEERRCEQGHVYTGRACLICAKEDLMSPEELRAALKDWKPKASAKEGSTA
jgi:hypothetical protein